MDTLQPVSFFWQSQRHLPKFRSDSPKPNGTEAEAISSPLRRIHNPTSNRAMALSPIPEVLSKLPTIEDLAPHEIMTIQANHADYICGVTKKGHICKNGLYCTKHTLAERRGVRRSMPLLRLMKNEIQNRTFHAKRRARTKSFYNGKSYWLDNDPYSNDLRTCFHSSCANTPEKEPVNSPHASLNSRVDGAVVSWKATLAKKSYLRKISRTSGENLLDFMSYVLYKLENYDTFEEELRIRELEVRWES